MIRRFHVLSAFLALAISLLTAALPTVSAEIALGVEDRLRISIYEWPELSGEYGVSAGGSVYLPLVGEVRALGTTPGELAEAISTGLQRAAALAERPSTSVEVMRYRPFYILGDVQNPGAYAFNPGSVVLNGVTLAGGYYRSADSSIIRADRDVLNARGDKSVIEGELRSLTAQRSRIEAELAKAEDITFPEALLADAEQPETASLIERETAMFAARKAQRASQITAIDKRITDLQNELTLLDRRLIVQNQELDLLQADYDNVATLTTSGLVTANRATSLQLQISDTEQGITETELNILRAQRDIAAAEAEKGDIDTTAAVTLRAELTEVNNQQQTLEARRVTADGLIGEALSLASSVETDAENEDDLSVVRRYIILRPTADGGIEELDADETTPLAPGDIIKVVRSASF